MTITNEAYNCITTTPRNLIRGLATVIKAQRQAMIWGSYGVGKSSIVAQLANQLGYKLLAIYPSQDDVIDYKLPYLAEVNGEKMSAFALSERLPREGKWIILVDEINTAPTSLQPTLYSLILDGRICNWQAPKGCIRLGAGNRETDKCAAQPMSAALKDRLTVHFNLVPNSDDWCVWAAKNTIRPEVMAFVRNFPQSLEGANPDDPCGGCTPRSLEGLSRLIDAGIPSEIEPQMIFGTIGQGVGTEFNAFLDLYRSKINLDDIIKNPTTAKIPDEPHVNYAIATGLAAKANQKNFAAIMTYAERMSPSYMVVIVGDSIRRDPQVKKTKAFSKFTAENHDIII